MWKRITLSAVGGLLVATATLAQPAALMEQVAKLTAADAEAGDSFGYAVAVDGGTAILGALSDDSAYIFERNPGSSDPLRQVAKLTALDTDGHLFGVSVAIHGDTVIVGSPREDAADTESGAAYLFQRDAGGPDPWRQVAKLTAVDAGSRFGYAVAVRGDLAIVGDFGNAAAGIDSGAAYVFERDREGAGQWGQVTQLTALDAAAPYDSFGFSVSVDGDTVIVGATGDGPGSTGAAYVFERDQGGIDAWGQVVKLTAVDGTLNDFFGRAVSIHDDTAIVGTSRDDSGVGFGSGSVYVFERDRDGVDQWGQAAVLTADDAAERDFFGLSVSIDGATAIVGANFDDDAGDRSGSAYVFERDHGGADRWGQVVKLTADDAAELDFFGSSVAVSEDTLLIGAYGDSDAGNRSGSAYVFRPASPRLSIPAAIPAVHGMPVQVPIDLATHGNPLASVTFSIDIDASCLGFDPTDSDIDGIPDAIDIALPSAFSAAVLFDLGDSDGELDVHLVADDPALTTFHDGTLATITFTPVCFPPPGGSTLAPVRFSLDPSASFDDDRGQPVAGRSMGGSVEIFDSLPIDLAVTKTNNRAAVAPGDPVTYTITVTNNGAHDARGVHVRDVFPPELGSAAWTCSASSGSACGATTGSGDLDETVDLPAGTSVTFVASAIVDSTASGTLSNSATVSAPTGFLEIDPSDNVATDTDYVEPLPLAVETLILTHPDRMAPIDGDGADDRATLNDSLLRLAQHARVRGKVVDLADYPDLTALYAAWDADSTDATKANDVLFAAGGAHDLVLDLLEAHPRVGYLILVGGDDILPFARFPDLTRTGASESVYTDPMDSLWGLSPDETTVGQALAGNHYLSDDPIGLTTRLRTTDLAETTAPFTPDLAVGRLVDDVDDITEVVDAFLANDGIVDLTTAAPNQVLVSGYHVLLDTAKANRTLWKQSLADFTPGPSTTPVHDHLVADYWDENDLLAALCSDPPYRVLNLNGHATHWELAVPGYGEILYQGLSTVDLLSPDPGVCGEPPALRHSFVYTADCHGGLSVPNAEVSGESLDLPEAMASLGVTAYLANTGFGWGLRCAIGYSERLVHLFTKELIGRGTVSVGQAANDAKSRYFSEAIQVDAYDLKILRQWRLSGIPNVELRVGPEASPAAGQVGEPLGPMTIERTAVDPSAMAGHALPADLSVVEIRARFPDEAYTKLNTSGEIVTGSCRDSLPAPDPAERLQCQGCYYTLNGLAERTTGQADLPIQPYFVMESGLSGVVQRGVLWKGGVYEREDDWKPLFGTLLSQGPDDPDDRSYLPRKLYIKPRGETAPSSRPTRAACQPDGPAPDTIVFTTAELADDPASDDAYSILKRHEVVDLEAFYLPEDEGATSCDLAGPVIETPIGGVSYHELVDIVGQDWLHWTVPVNDASGVWRVVVVYDDGLPNAEGKGEWTPFELIEDSPGIWSGRLPMPSTPQLTYTLQAVDIRGNVSWLLYDAGETPSGIPLELPWLIDVDRVTLSVPWVDGAEPGGAGATTVDVPVHLDTFGRTVGALDFELDYDERCLDPDRDGDGALHYTTDLPPDYALHALLDEAAGRIRVVVYGEGSELEGLYDDTDFLSVTYTVTCAAAPPPPLSTSAATIHLADAVFGDERGVDIPGTTTDGGVAIWPGPRGDCNGSRLVNGVDVTAVGNEIADGDGDRWSNAIFGTYPFSPVGCDANGDLVIDAADVTCTHNLIFGFACSGALREALSSPPRVTVTASSAGELAWIRVRSDTTSDAGALALSIQLDPAVFDFSNGVDVVASTDLRVVTYDAARGRLEVVLANLSFEPLAEGTLVEIGVPSLGSLGSADWTIVDASFGSVDGASIPGEVVVGACAGVFCDGFESGLSAWSTVSR